MLVTGQINFNINTLKPYNKNLPISVGIKGVTEITAEYIKFTKDNINYTVFLSRNDVAFYEYQISEEGSFAPLEDVFFVGDDSIVFDELLPIENNVNIERSNFAVNENFYKLSTLESISELEYYPKSYIKQYNV
jgi:hypothetical protein